MKKVSKLVLIFFGGIVFLIVAVYSITYQYDYYQDKQIALAHSLLNSDQLYIIKTNSEWEGMMSEGNIYTFFPYSEENLEKDRTNSTEMERLIGRIVGNKTKVDLKPYLNKPVKIRGNFYYGYPKVLKTRNNENNWLFEKRLVLFIEDFIDNE